jgi:uncharacterized membrane protein
MPLNQVTNIDTFSKIFMIALPVFLALDMVWLGVIAKSFYAQQIGYLMKQPPNWPVALAFYALFVAGLVYFVVVPAFAVGAWKDALFRGAFFGMVAYSTYDLTNLATVNRWPVLLTVVDIMWGTVLSASVAVISYWISIRLLSAR